MEPTVARARRYERQDSAWVRPMRSTNTPGASRALALVVGTIIVALTPTAAAQHPAGIEFVTQLPPFEGDADIDDVEFGSLRALSTSYDEELEGNIGIAGHYLFELTSGLGLGPRGMFISAEGDDTDADYNTFDAGVLLRYTFQTPSVLPYLQGGLGLTYMELDDEGSLDGVGWHISAGAGCGFPVSNSVAIYAGLQFHRQAAHVEGEVGYLGLVDVDVAADVVLTRALTTIGIGF